MAKEITNEEFFIVSKMIDGDIDSVKYYFDRYYDDLCNFVNVYLHYQSLSEEIVQDIFVYFWENREKLQIKTPSDQEKSWELYYEGMRRNDLVRFGKFVRGNWEFFNRSGEGDYRNVFPIPQPQINANKNLKQIRDISSVLVDR